MKSFSDTNSLEHVAVPNIQSCPLIMQTENSELITSVACFELFVQSGWHMGQFPLRAHPFY